MCAKEIDSHARYSSCRANARARERDGEKETELARVHASEKRSLRESERTSERRREREREREREKKPFDVPTSRAYAEWQKEKTAYTLSLSPSLRTSERYIRRRVYLYACAISGDTLVRACAYICAHGVRIVVGREKIEDALTSPHDVDLVDGSKNTPEEARIRARTSERRCVLVVSDVRHRSSSKRETDRYV